MPARSPIWNDGAVTTVSVAMIPHEPGTWMNRGPWRHRGTAQSELTLFRKFCPGSGGRPSVRRRRGTIREVTGFTCWHCYEHHSWDSRRPSARRPSGIPFHTYVASVPDLHVHVETAVFRRAQDIHDDHHPGLVHQDQPADVAPATLTLTVVHRRSTITPIDHHRHHPRMNVPGDRPVGVPTTARRGSTPLGRGPFLLTAAANTVTSLTIKGAS